MAEVHSQPCWPQPGRDRDRFCKGLPSPIPACTNGSFGEDCAKKCQCQNGAACDAAQGTCTCPPGFTGDTCVQGKLGRPLSQPGGNTAQGTSRVWPGGVWWGPFPPGSGLGECDGVPFLQPGSAHTWGPSCQCKERPCHQSPYPYLPISPLQNVPSAGTGQAVRSLANVNTNVPVTPRLAVAISPGHLS